jgi:signal transduction histidine kinase/DNA-binding NarL/FixJ family response regulator
LRAVGKDEARGGRGLARLLVHPAEIASEPEMRAALESVTRSGRVEWLGASHTAELRADLERDGADALLLDVSLAGHGALDVLRERRARGGAVPALVLASFGDTEAAERARALGGCAVLAREGLTPAVLVAALRELLPDESPEPEARIPRADASLAPAMLWKSNPSGELTHFTRRFAEFLDLERGWFEAVHPDDRGEWLAAWVDLAEAPRPETLDLRMRAADGSYRWVRLHAVPGFARDGSLECFVGSLFPIDDLVAARDTALAEVTRHEAANRELEELAFAGAHDLQEPLRSLERELGDALRGEPADLSLALRQVSRMRTLLRDLVDYAGAAQFRVSAEPSDLSQALEWALENLRPALAEAGAEIKVETLARVLADPIQVARVFQNLLANALRFRAPAAPVIAVGATPRERDALVFVRDNGIGIAAEHHETVFRVFERAHTQVREGSGMGLAICRRIVERHGGRVWVESQPGEGATFYFTLPLAE